VRNVRPKPRHLLPAALVGALVWIAAPALSAQRYMPEAVDFEQRLPVVHASAKAPEARLVRAPKHAGAGPVTFRSPVVAAPKRFDLVGLARELRPLEIRARPEGGEWTDWIEAEDGSPVYFGGADELQLRARGWRPKGVLHYVNVSGTTSLAGGLLTEAREAINSAFISASAVLDPSAEALPARPQVIGRGAWGAKRDTGGCRPRERPERGTVKAAVVHHTVTANDYSEAEAPRIVLGICRYHRNGNGWNDIGYNALVDRFGNIYAGRAGGLAKPIVGAQAQGFNAQTSGVATIGTHTTTPITPATEQGLVNFIAWKLAINGLQARGKTTLTSAGGDLSRYPSGRRVRLNRVFGHGTVGLTACPGDALEADMIRLRRLIQARIEASGGPAPAPPPDDGGGVTPK
jgi:hypothetical protein